MAKSLDCGTMFLVKGEVDDIAGGGSAFTVERNVFLNAATTDDTEETLKENNWAYAKYDGKFYILGEDAIKLKNLLTIKSSSANENLIATKISELRRPMQDGILNTSEEKLSVAIIQKLIENLLGKPSHPGETLCFCAPGDPIDSNLSVIFHKTMLMSFLQGLGYSVECIPEALAIIFSERPVAEDENEPGGEAPFSGISFSCLPPGQKVITRNGFCNIEDIEKGDIVLTKDGNWADVIRPISRSYDGSIVSISAYGHGKLSTTTDHLIWIKRDGEWQWIAAEGVQEGDYVTQPWIRNYDTKKRLYLQWTCRKTCSKKLEVHKEVTASLAELIGYFLGDGHIEQNEGCIAWTFASHEHDNIERVKLLCQDIFDKECSENAHGENDVRLKLYHRGFAACLRETCYNNQKDKVVPFSINEMSDTCIIYMLRGLIKSDGWETCNSFRFSNTSLSLAQFVYLSTQKLGFSPSLSIRCPRSSVVEIEPGRCISGTKDELMVSCSGVLSDWFISWMKQPKAIAWKSFTDGSAVARVNSVCREIYSGKVYDLVVDDDSHSFCVPGFAIHNCGAGMTNCVFAWKKLPLISFSVARGGDWIDREVAKVDGVDVSVITRYKEKNFDLDNVDMSDMRQAALDIFYKNMIEHTLRNFAQKFNELENQIDVPLEIVVAGGTASVPGFIKKFEAVLNSVDLPFQVKGVRLAENPLYAVSNGCLIKSLAVENKSKSSQEKAPKIAKSK